MVSTAVLTPLFPMSFPKVSRSCLDPFNVIAQWSLGSIPQPRKDHAIEMEYNEFSPGVPKALFRYDIFNDSNYLHSIG
jgi:hypothetical protein